MSAVPQQQTQLFVSSKLGVREVEIRPTMPPCILCGAEVFRPLTPEWSAWPRVRSPATMRRSSCGTRWRWSGGGGASAHSRGPVCRLKKSVTPSLFKLLEATARTMSASASHSTTNSRPFNSRKMMAATAPVRLLPSTKG